MAENKGNILDTVIEVPILDEIEKTPISKITKLSGAKKTNKKNAIYATGRRKEASARLWISIGKGMSVNTKKFDDYFMQDKIARILDPLECINSLKGALSINITSTVKGGGKAAQADALRLALARALSFFDPSFRGLLKQSGFLTCDARVKEREHYGFRRTRVPQQYNAR